jgi:hypothetical protein
VIIIAKFFSSNWVTNASILSTIFPLVCLLIFWKGQPRQNRILAISLCISLTADVIARILGSHGINNLPAINLYCIFAFPAIMSFYHETLHKRSLKIIARIFTAVFLTLAIIFALGQGLNVMNTNTWTLSSVLITITSLFFVGDLNLMEERTFANNRYHHTNIILNTSLAFYYLVTTIMFAMADYVHTRLSSDDFYYFWDFHNVAHILKNTGLTVAFYLSFKRSGALTD